MNSSENNSNKFDTDRLKYWKVKRFWNRFRKIGLYSVLACLVGFLLIDYLVHVPHERHAKDAGYFEKLKHRVRQWECADLLIRICLTNRLICYKENTLPLDLTLLSNIIDI